MCPLEMGDRAKLLTALAKCLAAYWHGYAYSQCKVGMAIRNTQHSGSLHSAYFTMPGEPLLRNCLVHFIHELLQDLHPNDAVWHGCL